MEAPALADGFVVVFVGLSLLEPPNASRRKRMTRPMMRLRLVWFFG